MLTRLPDGRQAMTLSICKEKIPISAPRRLPDGRQEACFAISEQAPQHSITLLYTKLFKDKILCYPKNFPTIPLVECWATIGIYLQPNPNKSELKSL